MNIKILVCTSHRSLDAVGSSPPSTRTLCYNARAWNGGKLVAESIIPSASLDRTQRVAWGVLLISFAIFCLLCVASVIGAYLFLFESTMPMESELRVSRGTAVVVGSDMLEQGVRTGVQLFNSALISTDAISQAALTVFDQNHDNLAVATVTLKSGSAVDMKNVSRPRFDWGTQAYWMDFASVYGDIDVYIPQNLGRDILITLRTTQGTAVWLTAPGQYSIVAVGTQVAVTNNGGEAVLIRPGQQGSDRIPAGETIIYQVDTDTLDTSLALTSLIGSRTFTPENVADYNDPNSRSAYTWRCNSVENDAPDGIYRLLTEDSRPTMNFYRDDGAVSHAETSCSLSFGTQGFDVSRLTYLSVRATFKVAGHSLSTCGSQGSECPLMLRMDYYPVDSATNERGGELVSWIHGFFSTFRPELNYPLNCDSAGCTQHEIVNQDTWYIYESGNLLTQPLLPRPDAITVFRFYASGHEYDVYVSEISLLADGHEIPLG